MGKIWCGERVVLKFKIRVPSFKGKDLGFEGKGLLRCLLCFLVILRVDILEKKEICEEGLWIQIMKLRDLLKNT